MKEELVKQLSALGFKNIQIEKDLELPANSLSAVLNGHKAMPDKWVEKVKAYILEKNPPPPKEEPKPVKDPTRPWIEERDLYCRENGFYPDFLIEFHRTHSNSATVRAIEGLKKALAPERGIETRKALNTGLKNREMFEPEEGTNAYFVRYGAFYKKDIPK